MVFRATGNSPQSHAPRREANERENSIGTAGGRNETVSEEREKRAPLRSGASLGEKKRADLSFGIFDASEPAPFPRRRLFPAGLGKSPAENFRDRIAAVSLAASCQYTAFHRVSRCEA